jgi:hypothetical protein
VPLTSSNVIAVPGLDPGIDPAIHPHEVSVGQFVGSGASPTLLATIIR